MSRKAFVLPSEPKLIADLNTTPLIDVLLVLLIMFIITVPVATHKVAVDLPTPGVTPTLPSPVYRLSLDADGRAFWEGSQVGDAALAARLRGLAADPAEPVLHFAADGALPYARFDATLAEVKRAGVTRLGFVGNQDFVAALR